MARNDFAFDNLHKALTPTGEMEERIRGAIRRAVRVCKESDSIAAGLVRDPFAQGSYPMHTLTRPFDDEYDIDIGIALSASWWRNVADRRDDGLDQLEEMLEEDAYYSERFERRTHCIRIDYAGDFHVDLVPLRGTHNTTLMEIPTNDGWQPTDPLDQIRWMRGENQRAGGRLTRTVKFLKHVRNRRWSDLIIPSIMLTSFAGTHSPSGGNHSTLARKASRGDADFFDATVRQMASCAQEKGGDFFLENPARPHDELTRDMAPSDKRGFRDGLLQLRENVMAARSKPDADTSLEMWQEIFGPEFSGGP